MLTRIDNLFNNTQDHKINEYKKVVVNNIDIIHAGRELKSIVKRFSPRENNTNSRFRGTFTTLDIKR